MSSVAHDLPHPSTTVAALLGTGQFPYFASFKDAVRQNQAFSRTAIAVEKYLNGQVCADRGQILDLFDSDLQPAEQLQKLRDFLRMRMQAAAPPRDFILYFVGHGLTIDSRYRLVVRASDSTMAPSSTIDVLELCRLLAREAGKMRCFLFLDACFAARAGQALQDVHWATRSREGVTQGLLIVAAAGAQQEAETPADDELTMFSGGLLSALSSADRPSTEPLVATIERVKGLLRRRFGDRAVLPHVIDPDPEHRLSTTPLFQRAADAPVRVTKPRGRIYRTLRRLASAIRVWHLAVLVAMVVIGAALYYADDIPCIVFPPPPVSEPPPSGKYTPSAEKLLQPVPDGVHIDDVVLTVVNETGEPLHFVMYSLEADRRRHTEEIDPFDEGALARDFQELIEPGEPAVFDKFRYGSGWYEFYAYDRCLGWTPYSSDSQPRGVFNVYQAQTTLLVITRSTDRRFPYVWTFTPGAGYVPGAP